MAKTKTAAKRTRTAKSKATATKSRAAKASAAKAKSARGTTTAAKAKTKATVAKSTAAKTKRGSSINSGAKKIVAKRKGSAAITINRRADNKDRRANSDRRAKSEPVGVERRTTQRRAKVKRRRQIDPTTCERDYTNEEIEFMGALSKYKRTSGRMFPTCSEILEVIRKLGYQKLPQGVSALPQVSAAAGEVRAETVGDSPTEMPFDQIPRPTAI